MTSAGYVRPQVPSSSSHSHFEPEPPSKPRMTAIIIAILISGTASSSSTDLHSPESVAAERAIAASFLGYAEPASDTNVPAAAYAAAASVCICLPCMVAR